MENADYVATWNIQSRNSRILITRYEANRVKEHTYDRFNGSQSMMQRLQDKIIQKMNKWWRNIINGITHTHTQYGLASMLVQ